MSGFPLEMLDCIATEPGVYLMKDERRSVIYVGKAKNLRNRLRQYFLPGRDGRLMVPFLTPRIAWIDTIVTFSEREALLLENTLIKRHQPRYNVLLKDDKTFVSLAIRPEEEWPKVELVRHRDKRGGLYFGPYPHSRAARQTLDLMSRLFRLRRCSDRELKARTRPCILHSIGRCLAPCVGKCTPSAYAREAERAIEFLRGDDREVVADLKKEMESASKRLDFERASTLFKAIAQIESVAHSGSPIVYAEGKDCDLLALHREGQHCLIAQLVVRKGKLIDAKNYPFWEIASDDREVWETFLLQCYSKALPPPPEIFLPIDLDRTLFGEILSAYAGREVQLFSPRDEVEERLLQLAEKNAVSAFAREERGMVAARKILLELQELGGLTNFPMRIDCFDISHTFGTDSVACLGRFIDGVQDRRYTRRFKIRTATRSDDCGALREVLRRHYARAAEEGNLPDLVLVDGGKGQLRCALEVFAEIGITSVDLIALAKESGDHGKGLTRDRLYIPDEEPISLPPRSPLLFILQKMRDEVHRMAVAFHRQRRARRVVHSLLDDVRGIGPKKRLLLLRRFGSVERVKSASRRELEEIPQLTARDIENLLTLGKS